MSSVIAVGQWGLFSAMIQMLADYNLISGKSVNFAENCFPLAANETELGKKNEKEYSIGVFFFNFYLLFPLILSPDFIKWL